MPILTPRFVPSCTDELLQGLGRLAERYHLPVQSHLSENFGEIAWVRELCPGTKFYGDAYDRYGLFGGRCMPQREVAALLGISRSYVSRLEKKAIGKLNAYLREKMPPFEEY